MFAILQLIDTILQLYIYVIFAMVILSWLITFNVINLNNRFVYMLWDVVNKLTEPILRPIRRFLPNFGGLDISPVILLLAIFFLQNFIRYDLAPKLL
ncbi:MAG: YggT family protein [Hyphomicrobiales bacterium]